MPDLTHFPDETTETGPDKELTAATAMVAWLETLDREQQGRALTYLARRYQFSIGPSGSRTYDMSEEGGGRAVRYV